MPEILVAVLALLAREIDFFEDFGGVVLLEVLSELGLVFGLDFLDCSVLWWIC